MPETEANLQPNRQPLPDSADLLFLFIILLLVVMMPNYVLGDGSTGWHLATGKYILQHGAIPSTDLFSNTFPQKAWVPYEWLSDLVGAVLETIGGIKLVAVATACAIALLFSLIYLECRRNGCNLLLAVVLTILGTLTSSIHWLARPHIFTFFGVFLFARHLERFRLGQEGAKHMLIALAITMVIWSNTHPGFLTGLALVVIYTVSEAVVAMLSGGEFRAASLTRLRTFALGLLVVFLATLVNPNALRMYSYIFNYLRHGYVLSKTNEFMPPDFKQVHAICMALIFAFFVIGLALSKRPAGLAPVLTVLAFAWLGINSARNEPLFAIVSVPITATLWAHMSLENLIGTGFLQSHRLNTLTEKFRSFFQNIDQVEASCTMHIIPIALTTVLALSCLNNGKIGPIELVSSDFDPNSKPTETLDCIKANKLDWRHGLNMDNWGGYIYYKTGNRVFIDDRLDFYGQEFFMDYGKMVTLAPDYKGVLAKHKIEWIFFPNQSSFVANLMQTGQWKILCQDKAAAVLVRTEK